MLNAVLIAQKNMEVIKPKGMIYSIESTHLNAWVSLIFTFILNAKIWQIYFANNNLNSAPHFLQFICFSVFIFFLIFALLSLINFKNLQKPGLTLFFMVSAPAMFFSLNYGTLYDTSMLQNAIETDMHETLDLLTGSFWLIVIFVGLVPSLIIWKIQVSYRSFKTRLFFNSLHFPAGVLLALLFVFPFYGELSFFVRNNNTVLVNSFLPTAPLKSLYKNILSISKEQTITKQIIDPEAKIIAPSSAYLHKPLALVVVVGETAREKSFSLRDTGMSHLSENLINKDNLIYFSNFWSCGTNTALSVPCMFSTFAQKDYQRQMNVQYENIAEIIQRVGYDVVWRDNNSGCKGICGRLINDPVTQQNSAEYFHDDEFYDEALVNDLASRISAKQTDQVIFLHQMGSHGPAYFKRTPEQYKTLQPACESTNFATCEPIELTNAYNNTVLYTKHTLNQAVDSLKSISDRYDTVLIYLSDHGESTGENGLYLHGIPYFMAPEEQTHIPALMWMSDSFVNHRKIELQCMKNKQQQRFSHDNLSHTLLGVLNIQTTVYENALDLFDGCRA